MEMKKNKIITCPGAVQAGALGLQLVEFLLSFKTSKCRSEIERYSMFERAAGICSEGEMKSVGKQTKIT